VQFVFQIFRRFPFLVIIGLMVAGGLFFREHLPGAASDLRVGDCFDEPANMEDVRDVQYRPCGDAHDGEVFGVFTHHAVRGASYPSEDGFLDFVADRCLPAFAAYTGVDFYDHPDLDIGYFYPLLEGWNGGDRAVTCYAYQVAGMKLTASVKKAP
jgi:hypothetical protein